MTIQNTIYRELNKAKRTVKQFLRRNPTRVEEAKSKWRALREVAEDAVMTDGDLRGFDDYEMELLRRMFEEDSETVEFELFEDLLEETEQKRDARVARDARLFGRL